LEKRGRCGTDDLLLVRVPLVIAFPREIIIFFPADVQGNEQARISEPWVNVSIMKQ
jgi:hypothetical protein